MKILAIEKEKPGLKSEDFAPHLLLEAQTVWKLTQTGYIREIYFTKEDHTAVIILEAADRNEALDILGKLPLLKEELIEFEVFSLEPYDGFERLFGTSD